MRVSRHTGEGLKEEGRPHSPIRVYEEVAELSS